MIDEEDLEKLFASKATAVTKTKEAGEKRGDERKVVSLIDPKRANHVGIALGRLKKTPKEIKECIIDLDDSKM